MNDSTLRAKWLSDQNLRGDDGHLVYLCSPLEQAVLQRLHKDLIWMLPGQDLAPHLYSKELITTFEYEQFIAKPTPTQKNQHLLMCLSRRPAGVLVSLLSCLDDNGEIPGVEKIAKALRDKLKDVKIEFSQAESVTPLQTATQKTQASPTVTVPNVVFEYLRDENKMLKQENEALRNKSEMLSQRATILEAKLKHFKKRVKRTIENLKGAVESSDDEESDDERHSLPRTETVKSQLTRGPVKEFFSLAYETVSLASSLSSVHMPGISESEEEPDEAADTTWPGTRPRKWMSFGSLK